MKYLFILSILCIGAVQIHSVYYDALSEHDSEFVLLENLAETSINITGYTLATPTSEQDATLRGIIPAGETYLIADTGWSTSRDNLSWPTADHEETLTLPNYAGYVKLVDTNNTVLDTLGWEDTDISEGQAHPGAQEGYALVRVADTGDNAADFQEATPMFENQIQHNGTPLHIRVNQSAPELVGFYIEDESPESQVISLSAIPGEETATDITITIQDLNTNTDVNVSVNGHQLHSNTTATIANYTGSIPITTSTTSLEITIADSEHQQTTTLPVELSASTALHIPEDIELSVAPGGNSTVEIPITNSGTRDIDIHIRASIPQWASRAVGTVSYELAGNTHNLTNEFVVHSVGLAPSETIIMQLHLKAGFVPAKEYIGEIYIAAAEHQ